MADDRHASPLRYSMWPWDCAPLAAAVRADSGGAAVSDPSADAFAGLPLLGGSRALFADPVRQLDARPLYVMSARRVACTAPAFSPCFALPQHAPQGACGAAGFLGMSAVRCAHDARRSARSALYAPCRMAPRGSPPAAQPAPRAGNVLSAHVLARAPCGRVAPPRG